MILYYNDFIPLVYHQYLYPQVPFHLNMFYKDFHAYLSQNDAFLCRKRTYKTHTYQTYHTPTNPESSDLG